MELPSGHSGLSAPRETQAVIRWLQKMAQSWECLLFTTGGAINLQKSFWILLTWQWKNGVTKLSTPTQEPAH